MDSFQKPPSTFQLAWLLVGVLGFAGWLLHLDWDANRFAVIPARDLVGTWVVDFGGVGKCVEIRPNGTYSQVNFGAGADGKPRRGTWSVSGEVLTWDAESVWTYGASSDRFTTLTRWLDTGYHDTDQLVYRRLPGLAARCTPEALAQFAP